MVSTFSLIELVPKNVPYCSGKEKCVFDILKHNLLLKALPFSIHQFFFFLFFYYVRTYVYVHFPFYMLFPKKNGWIHNFFKLFCLIQSKSLSFSGNNSKMERFSCSILLSFVSCSEINLILYVRLLAVNLIFPFTQL